MNIRTLLLVLALVYLGSCLVMPKKKFQRKMLHGRPKGGFVPKLNLKGPKVHTSPDQFIAMKVDHFDASNTQTYQKRYWYNNAYYKQGGPVFLYINGESEGTSDWITDSSLLVEMAQANNAFLFATEHRYYGSSIIPGQGPNNMQYLSSRQELLDLVDFVPAMNKLFSFPQGQKWVTFGGSYAGGLTALSRAIYPNTFYAAVGSSGVVNALVDYIGYMNVVQDVLMTYNNTMSGLNCGQTVKDAVSAIMPLLNTANGRQQLFKGFQLCQPLDLNNTMLMGNFWSSIFDTLMGEVQYGQYRPDCEMLTDTAYGSDALTRLETYVKNMYGGCIDIDYNDYIQSIQADSDYFNWIYQTCSEFGWYQSTDGDKNVAFFGNTVPVSWYVPECAALFGSNFGNSSVYANIVSTNNYYGGAAGYNGTRVVLPNGLADPWHVVGVLTATNSQQTLVLIPGGSHCEDMYADSASDTDAMKAAKSKIKSTVASWFSS